MKSSLISRKNAGLAAAAVFTLALGIGANTAIFSAVNAVLLNSAPMRQLRDPDRLVMVWEKNPQMMLFLSQRMPVALANFREWKHQSRSLYPWTAFATFSCTLDRQDSSPNGRPERIKGARIPPDFFSILGINLAVGRGFSYNDKDAVIMSGSLYRKRFGNDFTLTGRMIRINGALRPIIGVLPDHFELPAMWEGFNQEKPDVWTFVDVHALQSEQELWQRNWFVYARLRPGVTLLQARSEMDVISRRLQQEHPDSNQGFGINVFSLRTEDVGPDLRRSMLILQIAVGFVLLIACANVANLLLVRAMGREREIAIRLALGAGRGRIARLMLKESLLLSGLGGAVGLLLAYWSLGAIAGMAPEDTHGLHELRLDPLVFGFTILVTVLTGILFGLAPAFHASRQNINETLAKGGRSIGSGSVRLRNALVVVEVALALILLAGAGVMIRSMQALMNVDPGFRTDHLLTMRASLVSGEKTVPTDAPRLQRFCDQLLDRVQRLPGVTAASVSSALPMETVSEGNYNIEGAPKTKEWKMANRTEVTERFFDAMGIPILRGRAFTRAETETKQPSTTVVSESFAKQNWPGQDPLGKIVLLSSGDKPDLRLAVIGIMGGTHQMGPDGGTKPEMYIPGRVFPDIHLAVRTAGEPLALTQAIEKVVWSIDPNQPVQDIKAMDRVLHDWPAQRRFYMLLLGAFAALALLLAFVGLYGLLAYLVTLRTRELGVRVALGAGTRDVVRLVVGQGLKLTVAGIVAGLGGALVLTHLMESLVFGVSPRDPLTLIVVSATLLCAALIASFVPAQRATGVDPVQALRQE